MDMKLLSSPGDIRYDEAMGYPMVQQWRVRSNLYRVKLSTITLSSGENPPLFQLGALRDTFSSSRMCWSSVEGRRPHLPPCRGSEKQTMRGCVIHRRELSIHARKASRKKHCLEWGVAEECQSNSNFCASRIHS